MRTLFTVAVLSASISFAGLADSQPAQPTPVSAAARPAGAVKLFPDSRIVVRPRISVEVVGRGPDIVLIPGLASSRETWRATAERLRGRYRLHLVEIAGFAGEPARANASGPVLIPTLEDIDGYIVDEHLGRPILIGHSLGGTLVLALAERRPEHVSRALIVDALPFFGALMGGPSATPDSVRPMAEAMAKQILAAPGYDRAANRPMIQSMVTAPADVERVLDWGAASDRSVLARALEEDMTWDLRPGLASLKTPITLVYPDTAGPSPTPQTMDGIYHGAYAAAPAVKLIRVDGSRHFVMYDQPARFAAIVEDFLSH